MEPSAEGSSGTTSPDNGTDVHLAALCNRMGRLFYETKLSTEEVEEVIPETPHSPSNLIPANQSIINNPKEVLDIPAEGQIITVAAPL